MELLCPHCLKKVTVSDDKAGQILHCPLCQGMFAAPSLAPVPMRSAPPEPAPAPEPSPIPQMEIPVSPVNSSPPPAPPMPAAPPSPEIAPGPPPAAPRTREYTRRYFFNLRADVLAWIAPVCVFLILFFCSFMTWHIVVGATAAHGSVNLWQLGFTEHGSGLFLAYTLFTILALPVSAACLVLELRVLPAPPQLVTLMPWKSGVTLVLLLMTFLLLCYDYQQGVFASVPFLGLGEKLALRLHETALAAVGLELWVQSRRARHLPPPRFSVKL